MSWDYEPQESDELPTSGRGGRTVFVAIITSILTTAALFFALREMDRRGMLGAGATAARVSAAEAPAGAAEVPALLGLQPEQARELLKSRGLLLTIAGERPDAAG